RAALRCADRGDDEVLEETELRRVHHRRLDRALLEFTVAVGDRAHHPTARRCLHALGLGFLLQPGDVLLKLLDLFHHLPEVAHLATRDYETRDSGLGTSGTPFCEPAGAFPVPSP